MYSKIMDAAQIIANEMEMLHNRTTWLESELNKEKLRKEQLKQDLYTALTNYFLED